jgi:hypothetical protein
MKCLSNYLIPTVQIRIANVKHKPKRALVVVLLALDCNILEQIGQVIKLKRLIVDRVGSVLNEPGLCRFAYHIVHIQASISSFVIFGDQQIDADINIEVLVRSWGCWRKLDVL